MFSENMAIMHRDEIPPVISTLEKSLDKCRIRGKERIRAILMTEESLARLLEHCPEGKGIRIFVREIVGNISITLRAPGEEFDFFGKGMGDVSLDLDTGTDEELVRGFMLKAFEDKLRFQHKKGINIVRITAVRSRYTSLYKTVGGMLLGILVGILLKAFVPESVWTPINENLFGRVTSIFMNLLKTVVGPVVFFSIASSIAGFGDLTTTGRIGGKIMALYIGVSLISIGVGIGAFYLFRPGNPALMAAVDASYTVDTAAVQNVSALDMLTSIFPTNIVQPFLQADMLQIIFLSVIIGASAGMIGSYGERVRITLETMNELFLSITMMFVRLLPCVAFCSMASMILNTGGAAFFSVLHICMVILIAFLAMFVVYGLMLLIGGINPLLFYKKYASTMLQVCALSSSNASIPLNMNVCEQKLGISSKVYALSIPLGATINMHGGCIHLTVITLAFAQVFGISITGGKLLGMILSIILVAMGTPGIPGAGVVVLAVILSQFGIPVAAITLVMGINPLLDMLITVVNCLGDMATTAVVAKSEGMMDMKRYSSQ